MRLVSMMVMWESNLDLPVSTQLMVNWVSIQEMLVSMMDSLETWRVNLA